MKKNNNLIIAVLFVSLFALILPAAAAVPDTKNADALFEEWKKAYDGEDFERSLSLIKELFKADPAYREKVQAYLSEKKKDMAFQRVEMDPLLKRQIKQEQHLKRARAVKDAFDITIGEGFIYDTNPFRKERNVKYDFIFDSMASVGMNLGDPDKGLDALNLSYLIHHYAYTKHPDQDRFDHRVNFELKAPHLLKLFGKKITLNARDFFHPGTYYSTNESEKYIYQIYNEVETEVAIPITQKTSLSMDYQHNIQWYKRDSLECFNYQKNIIKPSFYYHITPKTSIFGGYGLVVTDYYEGGLYDSNSNILRGGIVGELTPKSSIKLETGYEFRNYHTAPYDKNTDRYILEASYTNKLSQKMTVVAYGERALIESTYVPNPYFVTTMGGLRIDQLITPKLTLALDGRLCHNLYPYETIVDAPSDKLRRRRDWLYSLESDLKYNVTSWLSAGFDYNFIQRISNANEQSYAGHVFTASVKANY